jgi:cobalt/nickel transport protein
MGTTTPRPDAVSPTPAVESPGSSVESPGPGVDSPTADVPARPRRGGRRWWIGGIAIAVLVVVVLAPLASSAPDGLERVAEEQGFIGQATNIVGGLLGDYAIPGIGNEAASTVLSGLLGVALVLGLLFLLGRLLARRRA